MQLILNNSIKKDVCKFYISLPTSCISAVHLRCGLKLIDLGASDPPDLPLALVLLRPSLCEPRLPCLPPPPPPPSCLFLSPGVRPPMLFRTRRGEVDMGLMQTSNLKLGIMIVDCLYSFITY